MMLFTRPISEMDFLQYARAGIRGILPLDLGRTEIAQAVRLVLDGGAIVRVGNAPCCFGISRKKRCRSYQRQLQRGLGLTRRRQQLIPLLTRELTNKEIANHFSLAEQTVKNHLYRMKRKIGAHGRPEIAGVRRQQGFLA